AAVGRGVEPERPAADRPVAAVPTPRPAPGTDARALVEREALKLALQEPALAGPELDALDESAYATPLHAALRRAITGAGGASTAVGGAVGIEAVREACADLIAETLVVELAGEPLRVADVPDPHYVHVQLSQLQFFEVRTRILDIKSKLQRVNPVEEAV